MGSIPSMVLVLCAEQSSAWSKILLRKAFSRVNSNQVIWLKLLLLTTTLFCKYVTASSSCQLQLRPKQPSQPVVKVVQARHKVNKRIQGGICSRPDSMHKI